MMHHSGHSQRKDTWISPKGDPDMHGLSFPPVQFFCQKIHCHLDEALLFCKKVRGGPSGSFLFFPVCTGLKRRFKTNFGKSLPKARRIVWVSIALFSPFALVLCASSWSLASWPPRSTSKTVRGRVSRPLFLCFCRSLFLKDSGFFFIRLSPPAAFPP